MNLQVGSLLPIRGDQNVGSSSGILVSHMGQSKWHISKWDPYRSYEVIKMLDLQVGSLLPVRGTQNAGSLSGILDAHMRRCKCWISKWYPCLPWEAIKMLDLHVGSLPLIWDDQNVGFLRRILVVPIGDWICWTLKWDLSHPKRHLRWWTPEKDPCPPEHGGLTEDPSKNEGDINSPMPLIIMIRNKGKPPDPQSKSLYPKIRM